MPIDAVAMLAATQQQLRNQTGRVAILERLVNELRDECVENAEWSIESDGHAIPNFAARLLARIDEVVRR